MNSNLGDLVTEQRNLSTTNIDVLSTLELLTKINDEDRKIADAIRLELPMIGASVDAIVTQLKVNGRLIYVGCGTSGRLGVLDASEIPVTFSVPEGQVIGLIAGGKGAVFESKETVEDSFSQPVLDLKEIGLNATDVVVGLAASGRTPYVLGAVRYANSLDCVTVGISCNSGSELATSVKFPITPVVGAEVLTGSTRMKAGTAQKMVLNMLSTGAMIRLGKCYGNLMVDMHGNACQKLKDRSQRILCQICDCTQETALEVLQKTNYSLKPAILMLIGSVSVQEANVLLEKHEGHIKNAIQSLHSV